MSKGLYEPLDWVMVRTPLLPVEDYLTLTGGSIPTAPGTALPSDPQIQRALAVGAGDLFQALEKPATDVKSARRLNSSLLRYLIRMSARPTPFGTFAGVAVAEWGDHTDLFMDAEAARPRTRPDMGWLLGLVADLEKRPEVRAGLRWYANPAACIRADRLFLTERAVIDDASEAARAINLRATPAVRTALSTAHKPVPYAELLCALTAGGAPPEKVEPFLAQLWEQTVLLTELRPPLTVPEPARYVADLLRAVPAAAEEAAALTDLLDELAEWDRLDPEQAVAGYAKLVARARTIYEGPAEKGPFQTDLALAPVGKKVNQEIADEAARMAELLLRLSPHPRGTGALKKYRNDFQERYGQDREVPLLELLDPELGLGSPDHEGDDHHDHDHGGRERLLTELALDAIKDGRLVVELSQELLDKLSSDDFEPERSPSSLDVVVLVAATSAEALDTGDFQLVVGPNLASGSAGRVLGRFADLIGEPALAGLRTAAAADSERNPGKLFAEISYTSRYARSNNVAIRPLVREREVAFGLTPSAPEEQQLRVDELVVAVQHDRLVIRHQGREVVPSAGHMLNAMGAPDVVRFLDEVSRDGRAMTGSFDWGPVARFPFLPRLQVGRLVLAPAVWRLDPGVLATESAEVFAAAFKTWQARWNVSRRVYFGSSDNRLLLDLDDPNHVAQLFEQAHKGKETIRLLEALPGPDQAWVAGSNGTYLSELVVPVVLREAVQEHHVVRRSPVVVDSKRSYLRPPGSDWLYAKLYVLPTYEDDLAAGPVREFSARALADRTADSWFFMRYADPEPHLRVRWHGDPAVLASELAPKLLAWGAELVEGGYLQRFALDTYDQEVERYGGPAGMELAERLFEADSIAAAELLELRANRQLDNDRTLLGVYTVDHLLASLGLAPDERELNCRERVRDRKATSEEFREKQRELRTVLGDPNWLDPAAAEVLARRAAKVSEIARQLDELSQRGELSTTKYDLARSFVHMHCNRYLGCGHPPEQRVLGLLVRTRESLARAPWREPRR
ncbi:lantibiotic dehydratase [Kribbella ginsengisoli]|uniref:Lantibiotic dehydratase n=1 Tax=Kribbella ginsengisoli TaxID=363865 RepID=A0ABP6Y373_9ACTN